MAESSFNLADYGITAIGNVPVQAALATLVKNNFDDAKQNKINVGIEEILLRNLRANKCEYQPDEKNLLGPYNDVYMGVSALKARAAESWMIDIVLNNIEKPWTLDPTPVPDIPADLKIKTVDVLLAELPNFNSIEALRDRAKQLKGAMNSYAFAEAEKATGRMETLIEDQMVEGDWTGTFSTFISDICVYPTAIIRGPTVIQKPSASWNGNKYTVKNESLPVTRVISPFDAYPSRNSKSTQDGDFFIERARFSFGDLHSYIGVKGFSDDNIRMALDQYPNGFKLNLLSDSTRDALEDKTQSSIQPGKLLDTLIYNGKVPGEILKDHGILIPDYQKQYECEVWVIGDYVVRAVLNPNPTGARPLWSTSFRKINGSFWGQSVICLTYDVNRICNAAARSLVRNMGYASGPIGEVVSERVSETEDPLDIRPYRIALVGPDLTGTGAPAYKFHQVDSIANDLMAVFDKFSKIADDLSGIPSYVLGNPQVAGAGRTLGGLSMLMGNAAKGIKNVLLNIDRDVISGVVTGFFTYNMITSDDDSIKADAKVRARGSTGLLQRELAQTRTIEILQLLTPYVQAGALPPEGLQVLIREILKTTGLKVDEIIPDPKHGENIRDLLQSLGQNPPGSPQAMGVEETLNRGTSTPVPLPPQSQPPPASMGRPTPVNMPTGA